MTNRAPASRKPPSNLSKNAALESRLRLAVVSSHPIQYQAPWFRAMAREPRLDLEVLFCKSPDPAVQGAGFDVPFAWDVPLLEGYRYRFLKNIAGPHETGFGQFNTPEIADAIKRGGFDAVLVNGWHFRSAWQAIRACWRLDVPVLARSDSHLYSPRPWWRAFAKEMPYHYFVRRLNGCVAVGAWSRDYFLRYGAKPTQVFVIPHTIDVERFRLAASECGPRREELRNQWGLRPRVATFLFAGKFIPKKRPLDFVKALRIAKQNGVAVQGLMVGDGALRSQCEQLAAEVEVPIGFAGFLNQSEIPAAYAVSDMLVLPSDGDETWGLVVNEAMACGRGAIVSDRVGCGPDLIAGQGTGAVFRLGDVEGLAAEISSFTHRPERMQFAGQRGLALSGSFSPEMGAATTLCAIESVCRGI